MTQPQNKNILIMAGGTGGHVYPALATARCLQSAGYRVEWLGTGQGIESRLVPASGITLHCLTVTGLRGKRLSVLLKAPLLLPLALAQALKVCRRFRPGCVLGMGGFASGPGGVSAWLLGIPLLIHEQNAVPGTTNRILSHLARVVMEGFEGAFARPGVVFTGNPVRQEIVEIPAPDERDWGRRQKLRVLVVGGSLGAQVLNQVMPAALASMPEVSRPEVRHQTGPKQYDETAGLYRAQELSARVEPYIEDMAEAYSWADVVVCRAGALTVSELAAAGLPSLLVPYPHAIDDHQTRNAQWLASRGGAVLLPQQQFNAVSLAAQLSQWQARPEALLVMARRARECARPDAAQEVATRCMEAANA
jgi:UDP-N-acetylglucosamine--N-acetylmuramyl-(pentapeptide) pyrophosphoryl-undecaprenol N-acetylglucosamine transferase